MNSTLYMFEPTTQPKTNDRLYINDYNLDSNNAKTQAMVKLVQRINTSQKYIDGIGTETHISAAGSAGGVQAALVVLASTGLEVAITELDIAGGSTANYVSVVRACLAVSQCVGITTYNLCVSPTVSRLT